MSDTRYLKRRRQGWYVRLVVPQGMRAVLGRQEWVQSLGTRDLAEANRRKHAVLAALYEKLHCASIEFGNVPAAAESDRKTLHRE